MKKSLLLMALLGSMTAASLHAEEKVVMWDGVTYDANTNTISGAVSAFKHDSRPIEPIGDSADYNMCGPASASNVLAWWLDQVEASGALIVPSSVPRGTQVWEEVRTLHLNSKPINPGIVMQYWLTGYTYLTKEQWMTEAGVNYEGKFKHLSGGAYRFDGEPRPENCLTTLISADGREGGTYEIASASMINGMEAGWGFALDVGKHYMTVYGAKANDAGNITEIYYSDNNYPTTPDRVSVASVSHTYSSSMHGEKMTATVGYGNEIANFHGLRSKGLTFDTYTMTMTGAAGEEDLFSHYLNLVVDGHQNYELKYDLRSADTEDSPVSPYLYTYTKDYQVETKVKVTTGDITLKDGQLSLVDKGGEFDGGGKTSGTITFEDKTGATRTLSVQHTDTIAAEIKIAAANGNTLEVTEGNTASFGSITGTGNLEKTGEGTLLNNGSIADSITLTVKAGTLKGSGTFGSVAVDGATLIVGNSPGRQEYLGNLSVNLGEIVFSVDGWATPATEDNCGWASGTYSNIVMNGGSLTLGNGNTLEFAVGGEALTALLSGRGDFTMDIATGFSNGEEYFNSELLKQLALATTFYVADEDNAFVNGAGLDAGTDLTSRIYNLAYALEGTTLRLTGSFEQQVVPEPTTGTLSLLALAGLAARRRKK